MNTIFLTLAAALIAPAAHALNFETQVADALRPFILEDSFAHVDECRVLDQVNIRPHSLDEARDLAAPCVAAVSRGYGAQMELEPGFVSASRRGQSAQAGLVLRTGLTAGSKPHRDLVASIERRGGELLGHKVRVLTAGEQAPASVSKVQEAIGKCMLTTVLREINSGADFAKLYGPCLIRDQELGIVEVRPSRGLSVTLRVAKPAAHAEPLNGFVTLFGASGPVKVMVLAYSEEIGLPAER